MSREEKIITAIVIICIVALAILVRCFGDETNLIVGAEHLSPSSETNEPDVEIIAPAVVPTVTLKYPPEPMTAVTNGPTPPRMTQDMFPDYLVSEAEDEARSRIDSERRPKVRFQKRLTMTNEWEDVLVLEPWRLAEFYRVTVE